jgi:hypothetical protein
MYRVKKLTIKGGQKQHIFNSIVMLVFLMYTLQPAEQGGSVYNRWMGIYTLLAQS